MCGVSFRSQGHHTRHLRTKKHLHQQQLQEQQSQQQHQPPIEEGEDVIFIKETTTKELPTISLQPEDYTSIVNNERLFTNVINKAQTILKLMSPALNGFQVTDLYHLPGNSFSAVAKPFVNILFLNSVAHFVCVSDVFCMKGSVKVYDSAPCVTSSVNGLDELREQVECLYGGSCKLEMPVLLQVQSEVECGVFAIAYATCIVNGMNPETVKFEKGRMREHLLECMNVGRLSLFPFM